ncbi:phosphatidylinositol-glycan biosynthesis class X protein isoform X1 [Drosophila tropicalis]|uniref:phosphatidylinositol-glycan biosynthesis class X protein isoform X1 n=1 Tax=Drosophila tropicalis TaxID=46794 RepID=UPI0035AB9C9B
MCWSILNRIVGLISLMILSIRRVEGDLLQQPIVRVEMDDAGFHRSLTYSVQFDYPLAGQDCEYMLLQPLPAGVYISTDELDDLQRLRRLRAVYPKFVDIEVPAMLGQPFNVLLGGAPKITDTLILPIHFRYHAPSDKRTSVTVSLDTPELYLNCPLGDNELIDNELVARPDKLYCLNEAQSSFVEHLVKVKTATGVENCNWKQIHVDYQLKAPLRADIPIGNTRAYLPVLYSTILLSWLMVIWTMIRTRGTTSRINQRLEEQRQLQQKVK